MARRRMGEEPAPTTNDPIDMAMEAEAAGAAPLGVSRRLLVNQNRLIKTQILSERAGLALKVLTGLAGMVVAVALGAVAWDAANTRSLVVEPFSVPADMAGRGMTGQVVATRLLDELNRLQKQTVSYRAEESYGNWKNDIKVEIPQTGVSIGELQAFLRQWLGEETRISGEVVRTADGIAVTARAGAVAGHTFRGTEEQLDALIAKSALTVYGATQPERFAAWLSGRDQRERAETVYTQITITGSRRQRAWAHAMLAQTARDPAAAEEHARQAVELDPDLPPAWFAVASAASLRGDIERRIEAGRKAASLLKGPRAQEMADWAAVFHRKEQEAAVAAYTGDLRAALRLHLEAAQPAADQPAVACRNCGGGALLSAADTAASLHDRTEAKRLLERAIVTIGEPYRGLLSTWIAASAAASDQDWPEYLRTMGAPGFRDTLGRMYGPAHMAVNFDPTLAMAYAATGRPDEAESLLRACPADGVPCL
ncbi:MAG TPA: hypothetical protein VEA15_00805, partial [Caulobacteraceae bacterium]|nr:hypothetical protein [Caulobacteraceae bacterium]